MDNPARCPACGAIDHGHLECDECGLSLRDEPVAPAAVPPGTGGDQFSASAGRAVEASPATPTTQAFQLAAADPTTPEYAIRAAWWCAALTILFPILVLPAVAFGFVAARAGRLRAGIVVMVAAAITLWLSVLLLLTLIGG